MRSILAGLRTLVLPWGATGTTPRIVIGPDIPPELTAYYAVQGAVQACILFRGASTNSYHYMALVNDTVAGAFVIGSCEAGVVSEDFIFPGSGTGQSSAGTDIHYDTGPGNPAEIWNVAALVNGWTNLGGNNVSAQYKRVASPPFAVWVIGTIVPGTKTDGTTLFTLPVGYRPAGTSFYPLASNASVGGGVTPQVRVVPGGQVACFGVNVAGLANIELNMMIPLDG